MSEPYYIVAVGAFRKNGGDNAPLSIALSPMVIHPDTGADPERLALEVARGEVFPESDGWYDHHVVIAQLDVVIAATIEAEKVAVPNELRIVRIPLEAP